MSTSVLKALIVDDELIARRTVALALEQEGFACAYASDGIQALAHLDSEQFDLVVTDLRMPNMHGHALAVELLARENAPVIVVHSSVDDPALTKDLMARGIDDIIYKPTNYAAFAAKATALVRRRKKAKSQTDASAVTSPRQQHDIPPVPTPTRRNVTCPVSSISQAEYELRLATVQHLFPLSSAASEVFFLSTSENTSTDKLVSTMLQDASLTADVLRLANSAYYNRTNCPTIDVEEAVVRIGYRKIGEIALALNALAAFRGCVLSWLDVDLGQTRSLAASIALERLREAQDYHFLNDGMTLCAFLHPLGRLVLGSAFQNEYLKLIAACRDQHTSLRDLELHVFPESHTAAISRVLSRWNLPREVCGPLRHFAESYDFIAQLPDPTRSQVELIKVSAFIGDLAAGRWMPWDHIEPPPEQLLARHHLSSLTNIVEQTRADLRQINETHKSPNGEPRYCSPLHDRGESMKRVLYCDLSAKKSTWMPLLLSSLGFEAVSISSETEKNPGGVIVNCLHAELSSVAKHRSTWAGLTPLLLIDVNAPTQFEEYGRTTRLPCSISALNTSCEQIAMIRRNKTSDSNILDVKAEVNQVDTLRELSRH